MFKPTSLSFLTLLLSGHLTSQTTEQHYTIRFQAFSASARPDIEGVLYKLTGASHVRFNPTDSSFTLGTVRLLDKQVISGKLQKHYYPVKTFIHLETEQDPFPVMRHTGNPDADAEQYEQEKKAWIDKHPADYQRMNGHP